MINTSSPVLKDWPASFVARMIKDFCIDQNHSGQYSDQREMLTAMAKQCVVGSQNPGQYTAREIIKVYGAVGNVLNHNVPLYIIEHLIEEICNGKA